MMEVESISSPSSLSPSCFDSTSPIPLPLFNMEWSLLKFSKACFQKILKSALLKEIETIIVSSTASKVKGELQIQGSQGSIRSLSLSYSYIGYQGINEILEVLCKYKVIIKELAIELDEKTTKTDKGRIESNCGHLIRQFEVSFPITLNGVRIGRAEVQEKIKEEERRDRNVIIEQSDFGDSIHICEVRFSDESIIGLRVSSWNV